MTIALGLILSGFAVACLVGWLDARKRLLGAIARQESAIAHQEAAEYAYRQAAVMLDEAHGLFNLWRIKAMSSGRGGRVAGS